MNDQEKAKAIERANSYRDMMNLWAWKDLMETLAAEKNSRVEKLLIGSAELEFTKGFIAAFRFIDTELAYVLGAGLQEPKPKDDIFPSMLNA